MSDTLDPKDLTAEERAIVNFMAAAYYVRDPHLRVEQCYESAMRGFADLSDYSREFYGEPQEVKIDKPAPPPAEQARSADWFAPRLFAALAAKDEEIAAMHAKLVRQAHDHRAQVVFWGDIADCDSAEIAALRAKLAAMGGADAGYRKSSSS